MRADVDQSVAQGGLGRDWATVAGLASIATFNVWTTWFTITVLGGSSLPLWTLATAASLIGFVLAASRRSSWALRVALGGNAAMRMWFAVAGGWDGWASAIPWGLALALLAATFQAIRQGPWLHWALAATTLFVAFVLVRQIAQGQMEAAIRQSFHLAGFCLLTLAALRRPHDAPDG